MAFLKQTHITHGVLSSVKLKYFVTSEEIREVKQELNVYYLTSCKFWADKNTLNAKGHFLHPPGTTFTKKDHQHKVCVEIL